MGKAGAVIVAAGRGSRMGKGPAKQFLPLFGKPVVLWSVDAFKRHEDVNEIIVVTGAADLQQMQNIVGNGVTVVAGGETRTASVRAGLGALSLDDGDTVLIHDAARPGLSQKIISDLISSLQTAAAAAPALRINDALKKTCAETGGLKTVDRTPLRRIQTPQAFKLGAIKNALNKDTDLVDDIAAVETSGVKVDLITGDPRLIKLTFKEDLDMLSRLLTASSAPPRMATGYDVHKFGPGDHVVLCGLKVPHEFGLVGHSDADVGWHALTDSILGALALGDIGDHFPPTDPQWKGAESGKFLLHAKHLADKAGYIINHVDITLICETPKIKLHKQAMRERTAELLGLSLDNVSVKATTSEGLGFIGRREGIAAQAAAVLTPLPMLD